MSEKLTADECWELARLNRNDEARECVREFLVYCIEQGMAAGLGISEQTILGWEREPEKRS